MKEGWFHTISPWRRPKGQAPTVGMIVLSMVALCALPACVPWSGGGAGNVVLMVPDGMGLASVTAARIYKGGLGGRPLNMETLETIGLQRTYSRNSTVTDSAPAASAWACGEKFNNGEICKHSEGFPNKRTILELAKQLGKSTGIVATSRITHATPAAFAAHVTDRDCENEIARQYIMETKPDVILGGGVLKFDTERNTDRDGAGCPQFTGDLIEAAEREGYAIVTTAAEMEKASAHGKKLLGLFSPGSMTPVYRRQAGTAEPTLAEMTKAALRILERNPKGFFLMVEGSQVDWANHGRNLEYQVTETLAFDDAVGIVLDWINDRRHPGRKGNTLLIVAPDHETGGFAINGPLADSYPDSKLSTAGDLRSIQPGWTFDPSTCPKGATHTGGDVVVYSQGPGSRAEGSYPGLGRLFDNTELYGVMKKAFHID